MSYNYNNQPPPQQRPGMQPNRMMGAGQSGMHQQYLNHGTPPQHGMQMHRPNMMPVHQQHPQQPNSARSQQFQQIVSIMPPEVRKRFEESDPEQKKQIINEYINKYKSMQIQQQQQFEQHNQSQGMQHSGMQPQRIKLEHSQPPMNSHPPQMQRIPSQNNFPMGSGGGSQFQPQGGQQQFQIRSQPPMQQPQYMSQPQGPNQFQSEQSMHGQPPSDIKPNMAKPPIGGPDMKSNHMMSNQMQPSPQLMQPKSNLGPKQSPLQPSPQFSSQTPSLLSQQPPSHGPPSALNQPPSHGPPSAAQSLAPQSQQPQPHTPQQQSTLKHSPMPPGSIGQRPTTGGPPSVGITASQPRSIPYVNSPQMNPPSIQGNTAVPTPGRAVGTPAASTGQPIDKNDPEHKELMAELLRYKGETEILLERGRADNRDALEKSLVGVLDIMNGKRDVDVKLLKKLILNLKNSIRQLNPVRYLYDFTNKITVVPTRFKNEPPILPDKWERLAPFKIRVPQKVVEHVQTAMQKIRQERKRKAPTEEELEDDHESGNYNGTTVEIRCVSQKAKSVKLPKEIADELTKFNFQIDPDFLPISEHVTFTQVLIEFKPKEMVKFKYMVPPLRLIIPFNYPEAPIQLLDQIPFRLEVITPLQIRIIEALKRNLSDTTIRSLTEIIATWRKVVVQQVVPVTDVATRRALTST
ncbi:hypothetical protein M3Y94_01277500 [Aphelenchoides besseyi]|nr:hypothetical protein M3Y94_01277500 [Aphelenchoides besseyi]KAI6222711.1 hypothetical protein M3Y95_00922500 [Aphelenchoides besseyi]